MTALRFDDHAGFHRDLLGVTLGGGAGALLAWLAGALLPWLASLPLVASLAAAVGAGLGLGVTRRRLGHAAVGWAAGVVGAVTFHLVPASAPLLGALLFGGFLGVPLALRTGGPARPIAILGSAALAMPAALLLGSPGGAWPAAALPAWVASFLGGAAFAFLVGFGSAAGRLVNEKEKGLDDRVAALPAAIPDELKGFAIEARKVDERIRGVLSEYSGDADLLARIAEVSGQLSRQVIDQIERWHGVERRVDPEAVERLDARIAALDEKVSATQDSAARQGFEAARDALRSQQALYGRLAVGRERLSARLHQDLATLEKLHLTLVHLESADAQRFSCEVQPLLEEVGDLSEEVDVLAEVSDALAALSAGPAALSPVLEHAARAAGPAPQSAPGTAQPVEPTPESVEPTRPESGEPTRPESVESAPEPVEPTPEPVEPTPEPVEPTPEPAPAVVETSSERA